MTQTNEPLFPAGTFTPDPRPNAIWLYKPWLAVATTHATGKMEVARRLTGPSAYVDLAGFHHEVGFLEDPSQAVDAILRSVCARLVESALALYPSAPVPEPPVASLDAAVSAG